MILQFNNEGKLDFKAPIFTDEEYLKKIVAFLRSTGKEVKVQEVKEVERFTIDPNREIKPAKESWTAEELILLFDEKIALSQIIKKIGRSEVAIKMRKAEFVPSFLSWCKKEGHSEPTIKIINKYLERDKE
jgi:vacuolar-type H+-ATPase subunit I/STV1